MTGNGKHKILYPPIRMMLYRNGHFHRQKRRVIAENHRYSMMINHDQESDVGVYTPVLDAPIPTQMQSLD